VEIGHDHDRRLAAPQRVLGLSLAVAGPDGHDVERRVGDALRCHRELLSLRPHDDRLDGADVEAGRVPKTISRRRGSAISIATVRLSLLNSRNSLAAIAHIVEIPFR